jgi:hypothetical protein
MIMSRGVSRHLGCRRLGGNDGLQDFKRLQETSTAQASKDFKRLQQHRLQIFERL